MKAFGRVKSGDTTDLTTNERGRPTQRLAPTREKNTAIKNGIGEKNYEVHREMTVLAQTQPLEFLLLLIPIPLQIEFERFVALGRGQ